MTTMMLADHGADVIRIEPPEGAPFEEPEGYRVWNRGKRSAVLDLTDPVDRYTFLALASKADVLVETFTTATCGTGCRGTFRTRVAYDVDEEQTGTIVVHDDDAAGTGTFPHEVRIPVRLMP
jgi:hypothetical protein